MLLVPKWVCSPTDTSGGMCSRLVAHHSGDDALHSSHTARNKTMSCSRELKCSSRGRNWDCQFKYVAHNTDLACLDACRAVYLCSGSMSDLDTNSWAQEMGKGPQKRVEKAVVGSTQQKGGSGGKGWVCIKSGFAFCFRAQTAGLGMDTVCPRRCTWGQFYVPPCKVIERHMHLWDLLPGQCFHPTGTLHGISPRWNTVWSRTDGCSIWPAASEGMLSAGGGGQWAGWESRWQNPCWCRAERGVWDSPGARSMEEMVSYTMHYSYFLIQ